MPFFDADNFVKARRAFFFASYLTLFSWLWSVSITGGQVAGFKFNVNAPPENLFYTLYAVSLYFAYVFVLRTYAGWQQLIVEGVSDLHASSKKRFDDLRLKTQEELSAFVKGVVAEILDGRKAAGRSFKSDLSAKIKSAYSDALSSNASSGKSDIALMPDAIAAHLSKFSEDQITEIVRRAIRDGSKMYSMSDSTDTTKLGLWGRLSRWLTGKHLDDGEPNVFALEARFKGKLNAILSSDYRGRVSQIWIVCLVETGPPFVLFIFNTCVFLSLLFGLADST